MNWLKCFLKTNKEHTNRSSHGERISVVEPSSEPVFLITQKIKTLLEEGGGGLSTDCTSIKKVYGYYDEERYPILLFKDKEACLAFIKKENPGKYWIASITSHVCTELILKEDC